MRIARAFEGGAARGHTGWLPPMVLVGVVYGGLGIGFATLAGQAGSPQMRVRWRLAAWVLSAVVFAGQIGYEGLALRNAPVRTAWHCAMSAALGAFGLAAAANVRALLAVGSSQPSVLLALVAWPALCGVPAWLVAFVVAGTLRIARGRAPGAGEAGR